MIVIVIVVVIIIIIIISIILFVNNFYFLITAICFLVLIMYNLSIFFPVMQIGYMIHPILLYLPASKCLYCYNNNSNNDNNDNDK